MNTAQHQHSEKHGVEKHRFVRRNRSLIVRSFAGVLSLLRLMIIAWVLGICIEWVGLTFVWTEEGALHSERMLATELNYLNVGFRQWVVGIAPVDVATLLALSLRYWLFDFTRLTDVVQWAANAPPRASYARVTLMNVTRYAIEYFYAAVNSTQLFAVRLAVLVLSSPIFLLVGIAALIDGLVERELRKYGGGNESAFVYHNIKPWMRPALLSSWLIYLALPFSLHPNFIFVPAAMFFGLTVYLTSTWFKKFI
ncbi:MAG: TIGR03747 family integrating conjugative element membrane protein [Gammaproteobacteria bacterium]|jgi:integrating conjugative element membrane protein (TIGR03747 family)